jgi:lon-related putative ATP-dependent protease
VDNLAYILKSESQGEQDEQSWSGARQDLSSPALRRYRINVLVDRGQETNSPVIYEDNPNLANLIGRVEYQPRMGTLVTDFNLIKPGALHKANGGYLILDAEKVLANPGAWEGLKRSLQAMKIKLESLAQMYNLINTVSLQPEPVPLEVKIVLVGSPMVYTLLQAYDPDFEELFKVAADFAPYIDRLSYQEEFARLVAGFVVHNSLRHFVPDGVARLMEFALRLAGDREKITAHVRQLEDTAVEADYFAAQNGGSLIGSQEVQQAIDERLYRSDRVREQIQKEILRDTLIIKTSGKEVGQINGLSVYQVGGQVFGRPSRITARVSLGRGEVVDIERESRLSGPLHSKGVLILVGFLSGRFGLDHPLSLNASLVFEQSYAGIDGDSASSAELYALLSAIAQVPLRQDLAVTGSVDQYGRVQAIGGVNEKIEGFFDICRHRGLTGEQGVLIPEENRKHLILRSDVRQAVQDNEFAVYPIQCVDQGLSLLSGLEPGELDKGHIYPPETFNALVLDRLKKLARQRQSFVKGGELTDWGTGHGQ